MKLNNFLTAFKCKVIFLMMFNFVFFIWLSGGGAVFNLWNSFRGGRLARLHPVTGCALPLLQRSTRNGQWSCYRRWLINTAFLLTALYIVTTKSLESKKVSQCLLFKIWSRVFFFCRKLCVHNSAAAHPEDPDPRHRSGMGAALAGDHHGWTGDGWSALCSSQGCSSVSQKEGAVQLRNLETQEICHLGFHHPPDPSRLFCSIRPHGQKIKIVKTKFHWHHFWLLNRLHLSRRGFQIRMDLFWSCAWDSLRDSDALCLANWPICLGWIEFCCNRSGPQIYFSVFYSSIKNSFKSSDNEFLFFH